MRIAIPVTEGRLCTHFGHCDEFWLIDADQEAKAIKSTKIVAAPDHEPGLLPHWLGQRGATVVLAGGMGSRAQALFAEEFIHVVVGAPAGHPQAVAQSYLDGRLETGENVCDH